MRGHSCSGLALIIEDWIHLLGDPDEGGSPAQFLQFSCSHVGACGAEASKDVSDGMFHVPFKGDRHRLSL